MSTQSDLVAYYQNTLVAQYRNKPRAKATIGALVGGTGNFGIVAGAVYTAVRDGFDLDTAVGAQLDVLGEYVGATRYFFGLDLSKVFLPLVAYSAPGVGTKPGIATYEDVPLPPATYTMRYDDFVLNTLQDGDYRRVLKFLAAVNSCDFAYGTLDSILYTFFSGNVNLVITGSMAMTYQHLTSDTDDLFEIIVQMGLLPAPAGVSIAVAEVGSF